MSMKHRIDQAKQWLQGRSYAYRKTFEGPMGTKVLQDLAKFCRAHETTASGTDRETYVKEGRREVWLRIQRHLQLTDEQLWELFGGMSE